MARPHPVETIDAAREIAEARPRVIAALAARFRDLDLAEEAFGEAVAAQFERPEARTNIAGWLYVTASRRVLDRKRREAAEARALAKLPEEEAAMDDVYLFDEPIPDERLRLIFICCHPALHRDVRVALTLRIVCGVPVKAIAGAFLVAEPAMYQRLTRAKAKIRRAGIAFETPLPQLWDERLAAVLQTLEIAYSLAYQDAAGAGEAAELGPEVLRLTSILADLIPDDPEVLALAALVQFAEARRPARVDGEGAMVPLSEQDMALWDDALIGRGFALLNRAADFGRTGPNQLLAAIHATHIRRKGGGETDWAVIALLYDSLVRLRPTPVVAVNRALAKAHVEGAEAGLELLAAIGGENLENYRPFHAAKGELLASTGRVDEALAAYDRLLLLDPPAAERRAIERRRDAVRTSASRQN